MVKLASTIWSETNTDETIVKPIWSETNPDETIVNPIYRPTSGNGEATQSTLSLITTQSGSVLTTQSGISLIIQSGSYNRLASTVWLESDGE